MNILRRLSVFFLAAACVSSAAQAQLPTLPPLPPLPLPPVPTCPEMPTGQANGIYYWMTKDCPSGAWGFGQTTENITNYPCCNGAECEAPITVQPGALPPTEGGASIQKSKQSDQDEVAALPVSLSAAKPPVKKKNASPSVCDDGNATLDEVKAECKTKLDKLEKLLGKLPNGNPRKPLVEKSRDYTRDFLTYLTDSSHTDAQKIENYCSQFLKVDGDREQHLSRATLKHGSGANTLVQWVSNIQQTSLDPAGTTTINVPAGVTVSAGQVVKVTLTDTAEGPKTVYFKIFFIDFRRFRTQIGLQVQPVAGNVRSAELTDRLEFGHKLRITQGPGNGNTFLVSSFDNLDIAE